ncbi:MAG TPA: DNA polymerase III subunit delta' [Ktedonobacterales bacterium]|nr:DNA polymerase III subunit delta' [Ktedonobacterales bacterium]
MRGVVGNRHAQSLLERAILSGQISHAYLLTGPEGIGKTTLALAFASALLCQRRLPDSAGACGECQACRKIAHGSHPDVQIIAPEKDKRTIGIDIIREMTRLANLSPSEGQWRIFILPQAEQLLIPAANALLKTLEEPPPGVILLLTCAEPEALLSTIISRCQLIPMQPIPPAEVEQALEQHWQVAPAEARTLATLANGRLGWAVEAHEHPQRLEHRAELLKTLAGLTTATRDERLKRATALASDTETARQTLDAWLLWWRDVTLAANGASALATTGEIRAQAERQGRAIGPARAQAFLQALLDAQVALDQQGNPRLTLENVLLELPALHSS